MKMVPLGEVSRFVRGVAFKPADVEPASADNVDCFRTKNVQSALDMTDVWSIPRSLVRRDEQLTRRGDILISSANSWNLVGKCCWIPDLMRPSTFGGFVTVLRVNPERADARYIYHWLAWEKTQTKLRSFGNKTTNISNLNLKRAAGLAVPLPPLDEQHRIATILDQADALRTSGHLSEHLSATYTKSLFVSMFPDTDTSSTVRLDELAADHRNSIRTGPFGSQLLTSEFKDSGVPVLGIDNVVQNEFAWKERRYISREKYHQLRRYKVHPGDVLITIMGTLGRCAVVPDDIGDAINTKHVCCVTVNESLCHPEWLHAYLLHSDAVSHHFNRSSKGAIMGGLNMGTVKSLPVHLPPLNDQLEFVGRAHTARRHSVVVANRQTQFNSLFTSLLHRAFSGDL